MLKKKKIISPLLTIFANGNPFVKFMTFASIFSGITTLGFDIANIASTLSYKAPKTYAKPFAKRTISNCNSINTFQTKL